MWMETRVSVKQKTVIPMNPIILTDLPTWYTRHQC